MLRIDRMMVWGLGLGVVLVGCEVDPAEQAELEASWVESVDPAAQERFGGGVGGSGARCSTFGDITTGCQDGEVCLPIACTNSIPPSCFGYCSTGFTFP